VKIGPVRQWFCDYKAPCQSVSTVLEWIASESKGRYEVITSDVSDADELIRKFKYEDYPQVAVSVDMLNTGFDCREILHLVMCRSVRAPSCINKFEGEGHELHHIKKQFVI